MLRGDRSSYTGKQKRQAEHIEKGYQYRGVPETEHWTAPPKISTRERYRENET